MSKRFGGEKLLHKVFGKTVIQSTLESVVSSRVFSEVFVLVRPDLLKPLSFLLDGKGPFELFPNPDYELGLSSTIRLGLRLAEKRFSMSKVVAIVLADLPMLRAETIKEVYEKFVSSNLPFAYPTFLGERGHPFFSRLGSLIEASYMLSGDKGFKDIVPSERFPALEVPVSDPGVLADVDKRA